MHFHENNFNIPKLFHRVWFDIGKGPDPPSRYDEAHESTTFHHPDWEIWDWDEESARLLLEDKYPWFVSTWDRYKSPIYKIDAIRYFILHTFGGVYIDHDVTFHRSIDPDFFRDGRTCVLVRSKNWGANVSNFVMGCAPGSPFMWFALSSLQQMVDSKWHHKNGMLSTMKMAGPHFLNSRVKEWKTISDAEGEYVTVLHPTSFCPDFMHGLIKPPLDQIDDVGYGTHAFTSSWDSDKHLASDLKRLKPVVLTGLAAFVLGLIIVVMVIYILRKQRRVACPATVTANIN